VVIPNGFDTARFRPRPDGKARLCQELGIDPSCTVIGMIARNHPMKDPGNLVRAVALLQTRAGAAGHLVIAGDGLDATHPELGALVREVGLGSRVTLLGERSDIPALVAGFDIAVLSSACGEGFPNTLGEAMASGVRALRPTSVTAPGFSALTASSYRRVKARLWPTRLLA
jgi:glycosyltransferase involved in cell wall biosynthesis